MFRSIIITIFIILVVVAIGGGLYFWNQVSWPVSSVDAATSFQIDRGASVSDIAASLHTAGLIRSAFWFRTYVRIDRSAGQFIAGSYELKPSMNVREIVSAMTGGVSPDERSITIKEGWSVADIAAYLDKDGVVTKQDFIAAASTTDSRSLVSGKTYGFLADKPATQGLEGYLFPDTYRVFATTTSAQIIEKMLDNFGKKFTEQMHRDATAGNLTVYQVITVASIIEKEVRTDADRKIAAGIFYDRLNQGVPLQSDATVNYVTGKQALQPTNEDVAVDSPYNTYKYKGLPPGPICNPSLSSLMAAVYPTKSDYFYFLTKPDGTTVFSVTYEEHLANKRKYLQ